MGHRKLLKLKLQRRGVSLHVGGSRHQESCTTVHMKQENILCNVKEVYR